jgi:1-acyl-sn-glycerol-3-phosphate acyltransferase
MARAARAIWRLFLVGLNVCSGLLTCALVFPFLTPAQRMRRVGRWSMRTLRALGIMLDAHGAPRGAPTLFSANHVSWLDIMVINAVQPARFVAKADVRHWPIIGWLVACGGTLFIERANKRDALRVVHQVAAALQAGDMVAIFPEGTTSDGTTVLPFHANLLQAAIATDTPVQPVALRYVDAEHAVSPAPVYIGETTLAQTLWRVARTERLQARVIMLPAEATRHLDRRALAQRLHLEISATLGVASSLPAA